MKVNTCYWCGEIVEKGEGAREHIVPRAMMRDATHSQELFIIPAEHAHKACNKWLGDMFEHDFCQMIFHAAYKSPLAQVHNERKVRNLKREMKYAKSLFARMSLEKGFTHYEFTQDEKKSAQMITTKIIKGLYFKETGLCLPSTSRIWFDLSTISQKFDRGIQKCSEGMQSVCNDVAYRGNEVCKFKFEKMLDANSYFIELVFYEEYPAFMLLEL